MPNLSTFYFRLIKSINFVVVVVVFVLAIHNVLVSFTPDFVA